MKKETLRLIFIEKYTLLYNVLIFYYVKKNDIMIINDVMKDLRKYYIYFFITLWVTLSHITKCLMFHM